ncbi:MAG TPA: OmpA family protein, partial [Saprospiraceae bacterium]|nr:OmpA family protein [Saprospiraceae bacterium]
MRYLLTATLAFWASFSLSAQSVVTLKNASEKAKSAYADGMQEAQKGNQVIALGYFERAIKESPNFIDAHLMWAGCQYEIKDWPRAESGFERVAALDPNHEPRALYTLALSEQNQEKYDEALAHAEQFLATNPQNPSLLRDAKKLAANLRFASEAVKHPVPFDPHPVGNGINSSLDEYLPSLTADGQTMVFTRREGYDENFFQSIRKDSVWQKAEPMQDINTFQNEGAQNISPDGTWLVFTACNRRNDGSQGSCDLYWSQLKNNTWSKPSPFSNAINSADWEAQPCISNDGRSILFSSTRAGGQGGKDLWMTTRQPNGKWATPQNLGKVVNSSGDEQTPYLHPDGQTLYFTSDGHPGMGKNDLYFTRKQPDGSWGQPQNLGYPINTKESEGTLTVSLDGRTAYFAAQRAGGQGGIDIYSFDLPEYARPQPVTYVQAKVTDAQTGKRLVAKVEFYESGTNQNFLSITTKSDGTFLACLPVGKDYALHVNKAKYLFYSDRFNLSEQVSILQPFLLDIALQPLPNDSSSAPASIGQPVVLHNVLFETGSAALLSESVSELDRLAQLLAEAPKLRIQINGHTDQIGDDAANQALSEARAKTVHDYLLKKNIAPERLRYRGFGETQPIAPNDTPEGRGKNRR